MNLFNKVTQQATLWVKDMMEALPTTDPHKALHALRAGLQALRDRLSVNEAARFSAQLPLLMRGIFFEGWDPTGKPLRLRHRAEFLALVHEKYGPQTDVAAADLVAAMFRVLSKHVDAGEVTHIVLSLPEEVVEIIQGGPRDEDQSSG